MTLCGWLLKISLNNIIILNSFILIFRDSFHIIIQNIFIEKKYFNLYKIIANYLLSRNNPLFVTKHGNIFFESSTQFTQRLKTKIRNNIF